jgi:hypothetical protein
MRTIGMIIGCVIILAGVLAVVAVAVWSVRQAREAREARANGPAPGLGRPGRRRSGRLRWSDVFDHLSRAASSYDSSGGGSGDSGGGGGGSS